MPLLTALDTTIHTRIRFGISGGDACYPNLTLSTNKYKLGIYKFNNVLGFWFHLFGCGLALSSKSMGILLSKIIGLLPSSFDYVF